MERPLLDRRQALRGAAFTFGLVAMGSLSVRAVAQPVLTWTPTALTPDQARTLEAVAEQIIPATDSPGAKAAGVPAFVDRTLKGWSDPADADRIKAGLTKLDADARAANGAAFAALTSPQQLAILTHYDAEAAAARRQVPPAPHFFASLKELVTVGYFTSKPGATIALRYDPVPGDYRGCVPLSQIGRAWAT